MKHILIVALIAVLSLALWGCADESAEPTPDRPAIEKTVAVVLPMETDWMHIGSGYSRCLTIILKWPCRHPKKP